MNRPRHGSPRRSRRVVAGVAAAVLIGAGFGSWATTGTSVDRLVATSAQRLGVGDVTSPQHGDGAVRNRSTATTDPGRGPRRPSHTGSPSPTTTASGPAPATTSGTTTGAATTPESSTSVSATSSTPTSAPAAAAGVQPPGGSGDVTCTDPVFTTSDTNGLWNTDGYFVHNNVWNAAEAGPETLSACSYRNWYVVSKQRDLASNRGSVKSYPNVHKNYPDRPISSFSRLTSTFAATTPRVGIYNVAYDLWLNGVASPGSTEIMVWTENHRQVPSGSKVATVRLDGVGYAVWKTRDSRYIAFVPMTPMTSGRVDLLQMMRWLTSRGWLGADATLGQVGFGVEIVSTEDRQARFSVTDFSLNED